MTMLLLNKGFSNEQLTAATTADLRNIGTPVWKRLLSHCRATDLRLYHITMSSLEGIEALVETERLALEWATKVERLEPVFQMANLRSLSVFDFPKVREIEGVQRLNGLTELHLSGSRASLSSTMCLTSIRPVPQIANLESFSLVNARLDDDDITPLAECSKLRRLQLSYSFDRKQLAFLAKHLNGQLDSPLRSHVLSSLDCPTCKGKKLMFIGRGMPMLCQTCDAKRCVKAEREFEAMVREA